VRPNGSETAPAPSPEPPTGPPVQTAGGRVFYGGGGITPDITVAPLDPTAPHRIRIFDAAFYFVRDLTAGQITGFENYRLTNQRTEQLPVTERLVTRFREYVRERQDDNLTPVQADADPDYVRLRLGEEIATAAEGSEAATRVLLEHDPQLLRALEAMPQAKQLAESVRVGMSIG
jgi:carboxyl-terminal processing protease